MPDDLSTVELGKIITEVLMGDISVEEAARRGHILDTEPQWFHCGSNCRFYQDGICHQPGLPAHSVHPLSVRCGAWKRKLDKRDLALPLEPPRGKSRMFK